MIALFSYFSDLFQQIFDPELLGQVFSVLIKIVLTLLLGKIILKIGTKIVDRFFTYREDKEQALDEAHLTTLNKLLKSILRYVVYFFLATIVLSLLGIPIASLIAGAGIIGLAVGFGAQNLVRDIISGFFILFEDQFSVGDYIKASSAQGFVEELGLRTTKVRGFAGELYVIPNGKIEEVTNYARQDIRVLIEVGIAYEEDLERAMQVMQEACDEIGENHPGVAQTPQVLGVSNLGDSGIDILIIGRAKPLQNWAVEREMRLRIKQRLDKEGIEIPYPRRVVIHQKGDMPEEKEHGTEGL